MVAQYPSKFCGMFRLEILSERGVKQGWDAKNQPFFSFKRECLENGSRYSQSYY